jgi:hypothetical protein
VQSTVRKAKPELAGCADLVADDQQFHSQIALDYGSVSLNPIRSMKKQKDALVSSLKTRKIC